MVSNNLGSEQCEVPLFKLLQRQGAMILTPQKTLLKFNKMRKIRITQVTISRKNENIWLFLMPILIRSQYLANGNTKI